MLRIPGATYRFQFNREFRFADARALVPYLHRLGITELYASPIFKARSGSLHCYDVTDPTQINPELGSEEEFRSLTQELKRYGMGLLLDIVPNHMAASSENPWWMDVLENGQSSLYAATFDIEWGCDPDAAKNKIFLPILGDRLGRVLENQELSLVLDPNGLSVRYYDTRLPLDPRSYEYFLTYGLQRWQETAGALHPPVQELVKLIDSVKRLPERTETDPEKVQERQTAKERIKQQLWALYNSNSEIKEFVDQNLKICNGTTGCAKSFTLLGQLLARQAYQLDYWRLAAEEINYRRFFDINDLAAVRVEVPAVFERTHGLVSRLVQQGAVTGLRIDHVDGLHDPLEYLCELQRHVGGDASADQDLYVVVEKILAEGEALPGEWPVFGTTGYDFLNSVNGVFVDGKGLKDLKTINGEFTGMKSEFEDAVYDQKKNVIQRLFKAEVRSLGRLLDSLSTQDRSAPPFAFHELRQALEEVTACMPVYRTYIRSHKVSPRDRFYLEEALKEARRRNVTLGVAVFDFLKRVLLFETVDSTDCRFKEESLRFVMKWQQLSGPVMAKGFEDTALYLYHRLISLNDVGGDPSAEKLSLDGFHAQNQERLKHWPHTLNGTSTHDTKRGEDHRARINVLSELPQDWNQHLRKWSQWNRVKKHQVKGTLIPDSNEEYLLYQTLIGAWPFSKEEIPTFKQRVKAYFVKAAREAKVHTSWIDPDDAHEDALVSFVDGVLENTASNKFLEDFLKFQQKIAFYGAINSLGQGLLKILSPGVPDFYQGTELWDLSLVDPDNRRPVDFSTRIKLLDELKGQEPAGPVGFKKKLLANWRDDRIKLYLLSEALEFRRTHGELFLKGNYIPLKASGRRSENICAYARREKDLWALVVIPRFSTRLVSPGEFPLGSKVWGRSHLVLPEHAPCHWKDLLSGKTLKATQAVGKWVLPLHQVLQHFPVALLSATTP